MSQVTRISITEKLISKSSITADDVVHLRREVWSNGIVDRSDAEALLALDHGCDDKDPAFTAFYIEALTDYMVWQADPPKYISEENAQFLIDNVVKNGRIDSGSELMMLANVLYWALSAPAVLGEFVLDSVRESVMNPDSGCYGSNRPPAVIGAGDVEIIHRVIHAPGGPGGLTVSQREAELLFDLNDATANEENASGWSDVFAKGVANFLMFPRAAPVFNLEDERRREHWLNERGTAGGFLSGVAASTGRLDIPWGEAWKAADLFGAVSAREAREADEARTREATDRESIDESETKWLIDRLNTDGTLDENEQKLLVFIKDNSPDIHPLLLEYMAKAGI